MYSSFVGIDIGKWNHQAAFSEVAGKKQLILLRFRYSEGFQSLSDLSPRLDKGQTVGLEATGHYWLPSSHSSSTTAGYQVINLAVRRSAKNGSARPKRTVRTAWRLSPTFCASGRYTRPFSRRGLLQLRELSAAESPVQASWRLETQGPGHPRPRLSGDLPPASQRSSAALQRNTPRSASPEELADYDIRQAHQAPGERRAVDATIQRKGGELKAKASGSVGTRFGRDARINIEQLVSSRPGQGIRQIPETDEKPRTHLHHPRHQRDAGLCDSGEIGCEALAPSSGLCRDGPVGDAER